jgi:hypothetical protein
MMDLVNGSGKFSKHFDKFNGKFMFLSETHIELMLSLLCCELS